MSFKLPSLSPHGGKATRPPTQTHSRLKKIKEYQPPSLPPPFIDYVTNKTLDSYSLPPTPATSANPLGPPPPALIIASPLS
jgi:hypothetical protein